jgi:LytS/YehU family sensor histidine kinase
LSLPACALQTFVNEFAFHKLALSYQEDPGKWLRPEEFAFTFLFFLWVFIAWSALYASAANAAEVRRRDRELAVAKSSAQEAQLLALRLQISPHFLFNTLNTLSGLTALGRTDDSERVIQNLSHFLRYTLDSAPSQLVALSEEIRVQLMYLEIEKTRFPDRLRVNTEIPSACGAALVPSLILLPLVENAVKHGLGISESEVNISLGATRVADTLVVWISHNGGIPFPPSGTGLGIGLRNVRERIMTSFGPEFTLDAGATADGWRSAITIPWMEHQG